LVLVDAVAHGEYPALPAVGIDALVSGDHGSHVDALERVALACAAEEGVGLVEVPAVVGKSLESLRITTCAPTSRPGSATIPELAVRSQR
jgi:hypothetical protein